MYREASPVLRFEHESWDEFLRERGRNFRQQVRRYPRKLTELGTVSYRLATDPERLPRDLDILFGLHRQRWGNDATAFLLAAPFHRDFAVQALQEGWLRLSWFLEINGKPVAALYGFRFAGAESAYQSGRDPVIPAPAGGFRPSRACRARSADGRHVRVPPAPRRCALQGALCHQRPGAGDIRAASRRPGAADARRSQGRRRAFAWSTANLGPDLGQSRPRRHGGLQLDLVLANGKG